MRLSLAALAVAAHALLLASVLPCHAQAIPDRAGEVRVASARARHLQHGVNASIWFAQSPNDYSAKRTDAYMDASDFVLIAHLGCDHVRLSIDPDPLTRWPVQDGFNQEFLGRVDRAVDGLLANGLAVIIDIHPEEPYKLRLRNGKDAPDRFVDLWRHLAAHYANRDPDKLFLEVMNEPEVDDEYRWQGIQDRVIAAIRQVAPKHTIIASGGNWDSLPNLLALTPVADGNVIYNFHFYEPYQFTHQGAAWGTGWWRFTRGVPYPANESQMAANLAMVPDAADRLELERYFLDHWDAHHIRLLIDAAAAWGKEHSVPVTCNEFGAFRDFAEPKSRAAWIHDVRTALEADGIGWTMWDYRGNFGVVHKETGPAVADPDVVAALGLRMP